MTLHDFNKAIHHLNSSFITGEVKITAGQVRENIDLLRGIITERKLPAIYGATNAARSIQSQTKCDTSFGGFPPCGRSEGAARFGCAAKLKDGLLVLICVL